MRKKQENDGLTVNAVAGTHVVMLGLDVAAARRSGLLGFAIQREDHTEDERYWLSGMKVFKATDPCLGPGGQVSSRQHPFQGFQWSDFSAKPDHDYTYAILALYGSPTQLDEGGRVEVRIRTEPELSAPHSVFFNRGSVASQEYARRFLNEKPSVVGEPARRWLSRGLLEALLAFIRRADGSRYELCGAIYEFQWPEVLAAIGEVAHKGAVVDIRYDAIPGGPIISNEKAIGEADIRSICHGFPNGKIMHNKFLVLVEDGQPRAVWTGSTNMTENGIFGHSNLGHIIEDAGIAGQYYDYWQELTGNPDVAAVKDWTKARNPAPPDTWDKPATAVFSPHRGLDVLEWYAQIASGAAGGIAPRPLFMTLAFGMHKLFQEVYELPDGILRMALLEKEGNGKGLAQGKLDIARIRALPNVVMAIGNSIVTNCFDRWLKERNGLSAEAHVRWVHTKYLLFDPLGENPVTVTGSANFSGASTDTNEENMLVIRGNRRVADIYLGEFMRLFQHYSFRESVARFQKSGKSGNWQPNYLAEDDSWQQDYFKPGDQRCLRRLYFSGQ